MEQVNIAQPAANEQESIHKCIANTAMGIAGCALAVFAFGALLGAAWPGAVAACGISFMGIGVAWVTSKRS